MSLTAMYLQESARRKFSSIGRTSCLDSRNQTFLASSSRNESNSNVLAGVGEKKIFHGLGVHHV